MVTYKSLKESVINNLRCSAAGQQWQFCQFYDMDDRWAKGYKKNGRKNILLRKGI